jgi:hypothetical protein
LDQANKENNDADNLKLTQEAERVNALTEDQKEAERVAKLTP